MVRGCHKNTQLELASKKQYECQTLGKQSVSTLIELLSPLFSYAGTSSPS